MRQPVISGCLQPHLKFFFRGKFSCQNEFRLTMSCSYNNMGKFFYESTTAKMTPKKQIFECLKYLVHNKRYKITLRRDDRYLLFVKTLRDQYCSHSCHQLFSSLKCPIEWQLKNMKLIMNVVLSNVSTINYDGKDKQIFIFLFKSHCR